MGAGLQRAFAATKATRVRTPQQQADDFVNANDAWPVEAGSLIEPDPNKPPKGVRYKLFNQKWYRLGVEASKLLPEGYPKWNL